MRSSCEHSLRSFGVSFQLVTHLSTASRMVTPLKQETGMNNLMQAFVMQEIGRTEFMDKPIPEPGPNGAVVKTTRALVCTSDVHTVKGALGERSGLTLGHEAVGVVAKLGSRSEEHTSELQSRPHLV